MAKNYYMRCSAVTRWIMLLNLMQQCYMFGCVLTCCAVLLHITKSYYKLCSVVKCYQDLLHAMQCCYVLSRVIT